RFASGERVAREPQDARLVTLAPEPSGKLLRVDWRWPSQRILRRIRALSPVPGLALEIEGIRAFVTRARMAPAFPAALEPGEAAVVGSPAPRLVIRTGDSAIELERAVLGFSEEGPRFAALSSALGPGQELEGRDLARLVEEWKREPISGGLSFVPD